MHPWHDCYLDETSVERSFPVVIEVSKGSKNKYELDKETGCLREAALDLYRRLRHGELGSMNHR